MLEPINFRILGHVIALVFHLGNSAVMVFALQGEIVARDKDLQTLSTMQGQFLTIWNVVFQITYSSLSLTCDVLTILNKDDMLPKSVKKWRYTFFESVVYPGSILVFAFFWPIYIYDRNLIFPEFIDRALSKTSNYIMHIFIVPVVLWETAFQPKSVPRSHKNNLQILSIYYILYNITIFYTYNQRGLWPYPLLGLLYGTIYFLVLHIVMCILCILSYYSQWAIVRCIWDREKQISKKLL